MVVVNNAKEIQLRIIFINLILIIIVPMIIWFKENTMVLFALVLIFGSFVYRLFHLKYFQYENSGEVISIRYYHPFMKKSRPNVEFPKNMVHNIILKNERFAKKIIFELKKSGKDKTVRVRFCIQGLSAKQLQLVMKS